MEFKHQQPQPFMMLSSQAGYGKVMEEFERHPWCLEAHHNFMVEVLEGDMFYRELHPAQPIHPIEPSGPIGPINPSSPLNGGVPEPSSWILLLSALISVSLVMCQARLRPGPSNPASPAEVQTGVGCAARPLADVARKKIAHLHQGDRAGRSGAINTHSHDQSAQNTPTSAPSDDHHFDFLADRYSYLRQFTPEFVDVLAFRSKRAGTAILEAVGEYLRDLNTRGQRRLASRRRWPDGCIPGWRRLVFGFGGVACRVYS